MADLLDIIPAAAVESVKLSDGTRLTVHRLHFEQIAALVARFPKLVVLIATGQDVVQQLIGGGGVVVAPIIAAACGHIGDEKAERIAGTLLVEDQAKLLKVIFWLTYPNGIGAFVEAMAGFVNGPVKESDKPVKVRLRKSPSASPPLSDEDSRPTMQ